ncbi:MAG: ABC transporter ATP-binding protein [Monoglobales bacterium]
MAKVNTYGQDEDLKINFGKAQFKKVLHYLNPYKKDFVFTLITLVLASATAAAGPYLLQNAIDVQIPVKNVNGLIIIGAILALLAAYEIFAAKFSSKHIVLIGQNVISDIRRDLFAHLQKLPFDYYDSRPHGKILVRAVNYVNNIANLFSAGIINSIMDLVSIIFVVIFMLMVNVRLTIVSLIGAPIFVAIVWLLKNIHRRAWQIYSDKNSNLTAYIHESINGVRITQAFVREKRNSRVLKVLAGQTVRSFMKAKSIELVIPGITSLMDTLMASFVFYISIAAIFKDPAAYQVGVVIAMTNYITRFWTPVSNLSNHYNALITGLAYLERIFETMEEDVLIHDKPGAKPLEYKKGEIEFKNVTFCYDEEKGNVLENISFKVKAGEKVALVGQTGGGKSTIVNLLSRYYNLKSGQILIDGQDISEVTVKSVREHMGYMLQDSFIFSGTIMENIRYGRLDATDEEVKNAAKLVGADDFISNMTDGYFSTVSERGSTLSAGQRQLISLARAMLRNPDIFVLDEATSSIDSETERNLIEGIDILLRDRTSFMIAHRLSTIKNADKILVIGDKKILEEGDHDSLMELGGHYYHLYTTQTEMG